jgi:hypothetical protein
VLFEDFGAENSDFGDEQPSYTSAAVSSSHVDAFRMRGGGGAFSDITNASNAVLGKGARASRAPRAATSLAHSRQHSVSLMGGMSQQQHALDDSNTHDPLLSFFEAAFPTKRILPGGAPSMGRGMKLPTAIGKKR